MMYNAPAHIRHKFMAAPLSKELAQSKGAKTLPVRKGDTVHIQRGDHKGFEGKVSRVDLKHFKIYVEGLTREKVDGTNIFLGVHPSKVMIKNLSLDDNRRKAILERKQAPEKAKETKKAAQKEKAKAKAEAAKAAEESKAEAAKAAEESKAEAAKEKAVEQVVEEETPEVKQVSPKTEPEKQKPTAKKEEPTKKKPAPAKKETKKAASEN